jgi:hypothetical protein
LIFFEAEIIQTLMLGTWLGKSRWCLLTESAVLLPSLAVAGADGQLTQWTIMPVVPHVNKCSKQQKIEASLTACQSRSTKEQTPV